MLNSTELRGGKGADLGGLGTSRHPEGQVWWLRGLEDREEGHRAPIYRASARLFLPVCLAASLTSPQEASHTTPCNPLLCTPALQVPSPAFSLSCPHDHPTASLMELRTLLAWRRQPAVFPDVFCQPICGGCWKGRQGRSGCRASTSLNWGWAASPTSCRISPSLVERKAPLCRIRASATSLSTWL